MRRKYQITFGIACLITLLTWLVWPRHEAPSDFSGRKTPDALSSGQTIQSNGASEQRGKAPNPVEYVVRGIQREIEMHKALERSKDEWRTPIEFYGKVVDEGGGPVENAKVDFDCNDLSPTGTSYYHSTSDNSGLFSLRKITGKLLGIKVTKDGYYPFQPFGTNFYYAGENVNFIPDATKPVVFRLKKKGVAEPLIEISAKGVLFWKAL